ncbi:ankyrin [Pluteus cervinus]|uniref:Ankyrin n=1 Tax=Pluteus cervinus TaxID=181527 RepID=A0ACD3B4T9_9AGAR|nr:ankyrin [Pluteus cervinus]
MSNSEQKNIWVAAGDGDLARVQELVHQHGLSPNIPDPFTYTPMHAAASYGHLHVLDYLIAHGGDVNITDDDGDTPLYTVETVETAQYLVEHGAVVDRKNNDGISPVEHLAEDFPAVSQYLSSLLPANSQQPQLSILARPSHYEQETATDQMTDTLMASVQDIMQRAEAEGRDPDHELTQAVRQAVLRGVVAGFEMSTADNRDDKDDSASKRQKTDDV